MHSYLANWTSKLQLGQTSQLVFARTFSDLNNCQVSTVMEHLSTFMRTNFEIDVPPDYLSVHLPHDVPLPGHYSLLELSKGHLELPGTKPVAVQTTLIYIFFRVCGISFQTIFNEPLELHRSPQSPFFNTRCIYLPPSDSHYHKYYIFSRGSGPYRPSCVTVACHGPIRYS